MKNTPFNGLTRKSLVHIIYSNFEYGFFTGVKNLWSKGLSRNKRDSKRRRGKTTQWQNFQVSGPP